MKGNFNEEQIHCYDKLRSAGIPLDERLVETIGAAAHELEMIQPPIYVDDAIYEPVDGKTLFVVDLQLTNISKRILRLRACKLGIPWGEPNFQLLPKSDYYSHPAMGPAGYPTEVVLNRLFHSGSVLYPGDCIEGLLLGVGDAPIPEWYPDRQAVRMPISIEAGKGTYTFYTLDVMLIVRRRSRSSNARSESSVVKATRQLRANSRRPKIKSGKRIPTFVAH